MNLFKHAAVFTDIHYGLKSNSGVHLRDCNKFIDWFIAEAHARGAETCLFLGDWHHQRASVNVATLNASWKDLKKLNDAFETVYFITGNHDLFYRDKRELNSMEFARDLDNFVMVDEIMEQGDCAIIPWLVGDEHKKVAKMQVKYMFGHFELPYFKMNAMVEMPDHGGIKAEHLEGPEYVFSGHFHKRQYKNNIHYIGNAFPHNYADVFDNERGAMFLEWDEEPVFVNWPDCPRYVSCGLKQLLDEKDSLLNENTYARVKIDVPISYEEATFIKEAFSKQFGVRELSLIPAKEESEEYVEEDIHFETVNQIVLQQLETVESNTINRQMLIDIYNDIEI